jgi:hypothetical protein
MNQHHLRVLICDADAEILINLEQMFDNARVDTTTIWKADGSGAIA